MRMPRLLSPVGMTLVPTLVLVLAGASAAAPQSGAASDAAKPAPAPVHDISGTWDPGNDGIQPLGPRSMPEDGKPEHTPPYTPLGLQTLNSHKPSNGIRS